MGPTAYSIIQVYLDRAVNEETFLNATDVINELARNGWTIVHSNQVQQGWANGYD